ncbi:hypothetical protein [Streptomyces mirabilis]|uniref:hypothetical protein n=1 Tax=Streptomyces mirabilis TaxID=68239 RepID=UPI00364F3792
MSVPAEVLDQTEQRENVEEAIVDFWKDADVRDPGLALAGSIDLDDGLLLGRELERQSQLMRRRSPADSRVRAD